MKNPRSEVEELFISSSGGRPKYLCSLHALSLVLIFAIPFPSSNHLLKEMIILDEFIFSGKV